MKTFDKKDRAAKAAVKAFGATAVEGTNYKLVKDGKRWGYEPITPEPDETKQLGVLGPTPTETTEEPSKKPAAKLMKTKPVKAAKPTTTKATKAPKETKARPDGLRPGTGLAILVDTVCRSKGATNAELCEAVGWKQCLPMMRKACDKAGVKLEVKRETGKMARYFGTPTKAAVTA